MVSQNFEDYTLCIHMDIPYILWESSSLLYFIENRGSKRKGLAVLGIKRLDRTEGFLCFPKQASINRNQSLEYIL